MVEMQMNPFILTTTTLLLPVILLLWSISNKYWSRRRNVPPSPPKLPIIGNIHQLGSLPHQNLNALAKKHGPIMLLHLGSAPVLIVSSSEWAWEITKTHDIIFANRPAYKVFKKLIYGGRDITASPYGEYFKKIKSIFVQHLVSNQRVQGWRSIREEETALFVEEMEQSCGPVNLSALLNKFTNDVVCRSALGTKYSESASGNRFLQVMLEMGELFGKIDIGDVIPWLGWISRVNGFDRRLDRVAKEMDQFLETVMEEHINKPQKGDNFMDILIGIHADKTVEASIDREGIKCLIFDAFFAGTDTTSTTLEWCMSELLRHPSVMEKLQQEVRGIIKEKQPIMDDDLGKMHYLKSVMKETLRLHPAAPLLAPRVSSKDVQIKGFDFSAGTMVMINAWAIGRDPIYWDQPEKFMPERFLNSIRDFRGQDYEYIPFGSGRRTCPGITFALGAMELLLANLVHKFNWKLPDGVEIKDLDMKESPGITAHRVVPLYTVASRNV